MSVKTDLTITVNHVLGALVLVGGIYAVYRVKKGALAGLNKINPANHENIVNQAVESVVGEDNIATGADYVFGLVDLINPFNESDAHAERVFGLGEGE